MQSIKHTSPSFLCLILVFRECRPLSLCVNSSYDASVLKPYNYAKKWRRCNVHGSMLKLGWMCFGCTFNLGSWTENKHLKMFNRNNELLPKISERKSLTVAGPSACVLNFIYSLGEGLTPSKCSSIWISVVLMVWSMSRPCTFCVPHEMMKSWDWCDFSNQRKSMPFPTS